MTSASTHLTEPEALSPRLVDTARHLQGLVDQAGRLASESHHAARSRLDAIAADARRALGECSEIRTTLLAFSRLTVKMDVEIELVQRGVAASVSAVALESACRALEDFPMLVERARGVSPAAGSALLLLPLRIAYRQCAAALSPLAALIPPSRV
jgi:hypothetical protein